MPQFIFTDNDNVITLITECPVESYDLAPGIRRLCAADVIALVGNADNCVEVDRTLRDVEVGDPLIIVDGEVT